MIRAGKRMAVVLMAGGLFVAGAIPALAYDERSQGAFACSPYTLNMTSNVTSGVGISRAHTSTSGGVNTIRSWNGTGVRASGHTMSGSQTIWGTNGSFAYAARGCV